MENLFNDDERMPLWEFLHRLEKFGGGMQQKLYQREVWIVSSEGARLLVSVEASEGLTTERTESTENLGS